MLFRDRRHAGILLANHLQAYRGNHMRSYSRFPAEGSSWDMS
jgi:hypothetical protein